MIRPHRFSRIPGSTACVTRNTDFRLTASTSSQSCSPDLVEWLEAGDARIVHQDADRPELALDLPDDLGDLGGDGDVGLHGDGMAALASDLGADGLRIRRTSLVVDGHAGTGSCQRQRRGSANASAAARHEGNLVSE